MCAHTCRGVSVRVCDVCSFVLEIAFSCRKGLAKYGSVEQTSNNVDGFWRKLIHFNIFSHRQFLFLPLNTIPKKWWKFDTKIDSAKVRVNPRLNFSAGFTEVEEIRTPPEAAITSDCHQSIGKLYPTRTRPFRAFVPSRTAT